MAPSSKKNKKNNKVRPLCSREKEEDSCSSSTLQVPVVKGMDDCGIFYNSHEELKQAQSKRRDEFYAANAHYWETGGYGGKTDDEAMIGDTDGIQDSLDGLAFLDRLLDRIEAPKRAVAMDIGAGVGRITKHVLLKRYETVFLVEGSKSYSKQSRVYLGRKRANRCSFIHSPLQDLDEQTMQQATTPVDLMWIQWTLQYLTDADVIECLRTVSSRLRKGVGILIVKENRPFGKSRQDRFQMDTPNGVNQRYDITRPDSHHRLLFRSAGLKIESVQQGVETNTYALMRIG